MIVETMHALEQDGLSATSQSEEGVTYAAKITKDEAALDFTLSAQVLDRKIRAFNPFPGAFASFNGVAVKFWRVEVLGLGTGAEPGRVLAANVTDGILIACGGGVLRLEELQKPGGKRLTAAEFLKGFPLEGGCFR
jgi:methionyl-tRNA formyltransferase